MDEYLEKSLKETQRRFLKVMEEFLKQYLEDLFHRIHAKMFEGFRGRLPGRNPLRAF